MKLLRDLHLMYSEEGDWVGLYLDGRLAYQGHSLDETTLLTLLGLHYTTEERDLSEEGSCPEILED